MYFPTEKECRGHGSHVNPVSSLGEHRPGTKLYYNQRQNTATESQAPSTKVNGETGWHKRPCNTASDCVVMTPPDVVCFEGECLCQPGYYFSESQKRCNQGMQCFLDSLTITLLFHSNYKIHVYEVFQGKQNKSNLYRFCISSPKTNSDHERNTYKLEPKRT